MSGSLERGAPVLAGAVGTPISELWLPDPVGALRDSAARVKRWWWKAKEDALVKAISLDQTNLGGAANDTAGTGLSFTTSGAVASGALIIVGATCDGPQDISSVTATGVTFTQDLNGTSSLGGGTQTLSLWSGIATSGLASGSTVTATPTASSPARSISAFSVLGAGGVDTTSSATANQNLASTAWASAAVTIAAGSILVGFSFNGTGIFTSIPTSPSVENGDRGNGGFAVTLCSRIESAAGSYTVAGAWSSASDSGTIAVAYKVSSGAPAVNPIYRRKFPRFLRAGRRTV